jgi:hypothetical protein
MKESTNYGGKMSEPQIKKRVRKRSPYLQIQQILNSASALDKEPTNDLTIAKMKFLQARLATLTTMQARENNQKLRKLADELKSVRAENEKLRQELAAAFAAKTTAPPMTDIERVIARYESEKVSSAPHGSATPKQQEE